MKMSPTFIIVSLSLITLLSPYPVQASHIPDLFESALDTVLCQNVQQLEHTIIDIRTSIERGATLVNGKWVLSLDMCVSGCCGMENCDFALYKIEGASSSGKNCYFVNCGDKQSNCVMVEHSGFTSVVKGGQKKQDGDEDRSPQLIQPPTPPSTTSPPPTPITHAVTTVPPSHINTTKMESNSETTHVSVPVSHSKSTTELKPSDPNSNNADKESKGAAAGEDGNTNPQDGGSGMIAVAIVGVVCFTIVVIVAGVLVRKIWTDQRRKRFRNVDYLINGMYT